MSDLMEYATPGERRVATKLVRAILALGGTISVNDGEEWTVKRSRDEREIFDALCTTESDTIRWRDDSAKDAAHRSAFCADFWLIWGNAEDGSELIADCTDCDEANAVLDVVGGLSLLSLPSWMGDA